MLDSSLNEKKRFLHEENKIKSSDFLSSLKQSFQFLFKFFIFNVKN